MRFHSKILSSFGLLAAFVVAGLVSTASAIPAFSRRYNVKCYACHTIVPVLNQAGYMFRRLGYHMPPPIQLDKKASRIADLVKAEPTWTITNNAAFAVADMGFSVNRSTQEGTTPVSTSSFDFNSWNSYWAGWIPNTNFFYYSEFDIATAGNVTPTISNAYFGYSGGSARSSWYADIGRQHLQIAEGTRSAGIYSILPTGPLLFENQGPTTFRFDHSPMGIDMGYTWASPKYRNIVAATVKVTNGVNADASEILGASNKNAKDIWFDADWWYAPESGVSYINYYGRKRQDQTDSAGAAFTYEPTIHRQGIFANYMIKPVKVDILGGYFRSRDDYRAAAAGPNGVFQGHDYFGEVDYYIQTGFAVALRYDRLRQEVSGGPGRQSTRDWSLGVERAFTRSGNIIGRTSYTYMKGKDPTTATQSTSKGVEADISFNF